MSLSLLLPDQIFTGARFLNNTVVEVRNHRIRRLLPEASLTAHQRKSVRHVSGLLAPGFVDLQLNGGGGVLFNDAPSVETLRIIATAHRTRGGTTGFLATLISTDWRTMMSAIEAVGSARSEGLSEIIGLHLEGPYLDPERAGVHDPDHLRMFETELLPHVTSNDVGRVMMTLSPEKTSNEMIRMLHAAGIHVSLGHSNASAEKAHAAFEAGAMGVTHLFNAMSGFAHRAPGMVGASLTPGTHMAGLIADGHHVAPDALQLALTALGPDRLYLVSDAMAPAASDAKSFIWRGERIDVQDNALRDSSGRLAGSNLTLLSAVQYCVRKLGWPLGLCLRMASHTPARALGIEGERGRIGPGARADFIVLCPDKLTLKPLAAD